MRTKEFTFKRTKRVKVVIDYSAISIDLTLNEAADLASYLSNVGTPDCRFQPLLDALLNFTGKNCAVSDLVPKNGGVCFQMVKR